MKNITLDALLAFCAVVMGAVFMRILPHPPNIAPIAALALFCGITVPNWRGFALPIIVMVLSDIFLGFHATIPFVYGSFMLIVGIGYLLRKNKSPRNIILGSLIGSILFFFVSNFGVWMTSPMYEKTFSGLLHCYEMGIPFFRNTVIGDLLYTGIFFIGYRYLRLLFVLMMPSIQKIERHIGNTV